MMCCILSVKRTALLGIFISTFMFTGYVHSEQPIITYENKPMVELRQPIMNERPPLRRNSDNPFLVDKRLVDKRLLDTNYYNDPIVGHISDYTPEQRLQILSKNKGNKSLSIASNNNVSSSSSFENKTPRKLRIDDFVFPIALLIFISIMSIPISLLWRFGLKVPASLFIITTAGISCSMLLLLAFG
ncbi:hypothetical protein [Bartonella schoenbuchensis]|uniref:hypothetical protein n=1 Tax=Bartonella schoenbuchensis TaxID=165694 RepID=UPI0031453281